MNRTVLLLVALVLAGCDVHEENYAPSDAASVARSDYESGGCNFHRRDQHLLDEKNAGYNTVYLQKYDETYVDVCEHLRTHNYK